ncbi:MAG: flagellar basal body rod protein FlgC [Thiotrichaceae bacterium]|nr:flagellar basal body rod protein FlgC [Thiotrichaceae bacterium]PCI15088.1 MAG: flagellar basal body rod protein FlgC [Thiotrichales bacterium]
MSLMSVFNISSSAMNAQSIRLNTTASNLANAESVSSSEAGAYRARQPIFETVLNNITGEVEGVTVTGVVKSEAPVMKQYSPGNPMADKEGYIYRSNVNAMEEMANMISASRSYQNNVQVMNTSKEMLMSTLRLGQ